MRNYDIKIAENAARKAYFNFIEKLTRYINIMAENNMPFNSLIGIKRSALVFKRRFDDPPMVPPGGGRTFIQPMGKESNKIVLSESMMKLVNEVLNEFNVDIKEAAEFGLVTEKQMQSVLIKYQYAEMAKTDITYKEAKQKLKDKYGWSLSRIEKLVYG